ncbi:WD40-repeat-containing domain protein [Amanita rubescens]|nr:WD40-repeat-containing domain protein [Amanita rubescens]
MTCIDDNPLSLVFQGHCRPINCAKFSPDCSLIATGGDDGDIYVWSLARRELDCRISADQGPIATLDWINNPCAFGRHYLISAGADGALKLWIKGESRVKGFAFVASHQLFDGQVESIDLHRNLLAAVGSGRVALLELVLDALPPFRHVITDPEFQPGTSRMPALARSVHFFQDGQSVMVNYLDARVIAAWNIAPWRLMWKYRIATRIGNTAWDDETRTLLVWNLNDGISVYRIDDGPPVLITKLEMTIRRNFPVQVTFGPNACLAISGSDNGHIYTWDLHTRKLVQVLQHCEDEVAVQTISFACAGYGRYLIASASSEHNGKEQTIVIWTSVRPIVP